MASSNTAAENSAPTGRIAQMRAIWRMTRTHDPKAKWLVLAVFLGVMAFFALLGWLMFLRGSEGATGWFSPGLKFSLFLALGALPLAVMFALLVIGRRGEAVAYGLMGGQTGATLAPLQNLRGGWSVDQEPIAIDPRTQDLVFRAVGRPGVVLITEGPTQRVSKLVEAERKRHARVLSGIPITVVHAGDGEGQIPLRKLASHVMRLKSVLRKAEVSEVAKRLKALGGVKMPIPKGLDPTRIRPSRGR